MTAIKDMSLEQLRGELEWSTRQLEVHRRDGDRIWCIQRCDEGFPCDQSLAASAAVKEVSDVLVARRDRIEKANAEWRGP